MQTLETTNRRGNERLSRLRESGLARCRAPEVQLQLQDRTQDRTLYLYSGVTLLL